MGGMMIPEGNKSAQIKLFLLLSLSPQFLTSRLSLCAVKGSRIVVNSYYKGVAVSWKQPRLTNNGPRETGPIHCIEELLNGMDCVGLVVVRVRFADEMIFLRRPNLFTICNNTFSKWWEG
jgi:hypothetical protein